MKRNPFLISILFFALTLFISNSYAQEYVHYATFAGDLYTGTTTSFSPDGRILASSGGMKNNALLWDTEAGVHLRTLTGFKKPVISLSFSPDGRTLAGGDYGTVLLFDTATGKLKKSVTHFMIHIPHSLSFSPDGRTLLVGTDGPIILFNAITGRYRKMLFGHTRSVICMAFSPNGAMLASASDDRTIRLWDTESGEHLRTLTTEGHEPLVWNLSFSPDGRTLASAGSDLGIRLWDVGSGVFLRRLTKEKIFFQSAAFSPDGRILAGGSVNGNIYLLDVESGAHKQILTGHTSVVDSVSFSPNGNILASESYDKTIRLWRVSTPQPTADQVYNDAIRAVVWIVNAGRYEGSGVLLDKRYRLVVTNAHVTGSQNTIDVYFPTPDENSEFIKDRDFYLKNSGALKRFNYYTKGQVVAKNEENDLAIIKLNGLPETAREIDWNLTAPTASAGDLVYILGNPGGQDLWRWTLGEFLNDSGDFLHIQSDVFSGNSGGPVLNKQGILIGIVARSDRHMNALAIPLRDVIQLLFESGLTNSYTR